MENTGILKRLFKSKTVVMIFIVAVIVIVFFIANNNYLGIDNIKSILIAMSMSGIIAVGVACLLIGGGVDLASGAEGMFGGVLVALLLREGMPWPLALLCVILYGCTAGAINAFFVNGLGFMGFIVTSAMASVYKGLALVLTSNQNVPISNQSFWGVGSYAVFGFLPMPFLIMLALILVYAFILTKTQFGRNIYLVGGNRQAARLAGINPKKIQTILYINCGAIAALGGAVLSSRMHSGAPTAVLGAELDSITAAVLGGVSFSGGAGSMGGCLIGLLMLNCFENGLTAVGFDAYWQIIAQGVLLIIALIIDYYNEQSRLKALKVQAN